MIGMFDRKNLSWDIEKRSLDPLVHVRESDDEVIVTADLPCVKKEDVELYIEERSLAIKAKMKKEMRFESWGGVHRKYKFNSFRKSITLPARIDPEKVEAEFKKCMLKVTLKKKKPKSIRIE